MVQATFGDVQNVKAISKIHAMVKTGGFNQIKFITNVFPFVLLNIMGYN